MPLFLLSPYTFHSPSVSFLALLTLLLPLPPQIGVCDLDSHPGPTLSWQVTLVKLIS